MKIRNRITLWITGAGLLASLTLSLIVFVNMLEQPYELLDQELDTHGHALAASLKIQDDGSFTQNRLFDHLTGLYWVKIFTQQKQLLYQSPLALLTDLPIKSTDYGYTVDTALSMNQVYPEEDNDSVAFRVRIFTVPVTDKNYLLQIARPIENLDKELIEIVLIFLLGLAVAALILILFGYWVAGRILHPIREINVLAREITDKTLDKRLPLGTNFDELYALSAALNQMFDRLHHSFILQKEFIANAAHELKTPITILRLSVEEALQHEDLPEPLLRQLTGQGKALIRIDSLVKNLLNLSTLELQPTCKCDQFDLVELARDISDEFDEILRTQEVQVKMDIPDTLLFCADREKIRRMLINLMDNAIKYNNHGGMIGLKIRVEEENICIELYNTGPGIPAAELTKVFNQFHRVEKSRSTEYGGSGLGLTIVKRIVELHHGTITIESEPDRWTRVRVLLPVSR